MEIVRRLLGVFLVVIAIVVAINLMATPLYHDGSEDYPIWKIVNWFMAVGVVAALIVSAMRKRALGAGGSDEPSVREYLRVNLTYYTTIILTILFFWGWFWTLNPDSETGEAVTSHLVYFPIMDALFVRLRLVVRPQCDPGARQSCAWPPAATCGRTLLKPGDEPPGSPRILRANAQVDTGRLRLVVRPQCDPGARQGHCGTEGVAKLS